MAETVRDVMSSNPVIIEANQPARDAAIAMRDRDIGDVIVAENGEVRGIVTDRDIVVRCLAEGKSPSETPLSEICSSDLITVSPDDNADEVIELMRQKAIRRVPVVENGEAVGIVSLGDMAVDRDPRSVLGQISRAPSNN